CCSSLDVKKPPVAPKPKFVVASKSLPPPVAPKPDVVSPHCASAPKKPKPVIAPKPKFSKSSAATDVGAVSPRNVANSLQENQQDSSENIGSLNCRNGTRIGVVDATSNYIIPICACSFECNHKFGYEESLCKTRIVVDQLEKLEGLENGKIVGQTKLSVNAKIEQEMLAEKMHRNEVVLKASMLEQKLKDVLAQTVSPNNCHLKHKAMNKGLETYVETVGSSKGKLDIIDFDPAPSDSDELLGKNSVKSNFSNIDPETMQVNSQSYNLSATQEKEKLENKTKSCSASLEKSCLLPEDDRTSQGGSGPVLTPCNKALPVPKPRKRCTTGLVRQNCIEAPADDPREQNLSFNDSDESIENSLKSTQIHVLDQCVSYSDMQIGKETRTVKENILFPQDTDVKTKPVIESITTEVLVSPNVSSLKQVGTVQMSIDLEHNTSCPTKPAKDTTYLSTEKQSSFIRCNSLSMSLPKQLKLAYSQHLSSSSLEVREGQSDGRGAPPKSTDSPKVAPKKPQRHSLPAAGLLKKAASADLADGRYVSSDKNNLGLNSKGTPQRDALAKERCLSSASNVPKKPLEKPIWKLPHPILPFVGNPEALKVGNTSPSSEPVARVTKPRAKSLSSVDVEKTDKNTKESQKKTPFRKILNMKLSVCISKSDFQRLLLKGSHSSDNSTTGPPSTDGNGAGCKHSSPTSLSSDKKSKPVKAYSADSCGSGSQKKGLKHKNQYEMHSKARSLDDHLKGSKEQWSKTPSDSFGVNCSPEYENVQHYEEIPEYANLPFAISTEKCPQSTSLGCKSSFNLENCTAGVYEVEEPYETTSNYLRYKPKNVYDRKGTTQHNINNSGIGDVHSDEEEGLNSSDEDDSNSNSSKELDQQEDKQNDGGRKKTKVFHIAKEIMSSEKVFVDVLKLLHVLDYNTRESMENGSMEKIPAKISSVIILKILALLLQLMILLRSLPKELARCLQWWNEHQRIADIFVKKGPYLKMYSTYIKEFDKNVALLDEQCKKNPGFAASVREFEMSPRCASLALKHYLLKPVQRIPQYRLLLTVFLVNLI
uniref:DH domain-containing protein n=1 Tax=Latimeria chalumnae TaxID=7897 RepID=H3AEB5_LATCH